MAGVITDVPGVRVGHWTQDAGPTGCTVVLLPAGTVASGEIRGGAPGTREWALLSPERTVTQVDAVVLAGGSAFGLEACDGVARWCEERGIGFPTPAGPVPIVVGAVLFDLLVGDPAVRPTAASGYEACVAAVGAGAHLPVGRVGAGTGATVGKWQGFEHARPAGIGTASRRQGDVVVAALVAVNAFGDLRPASTGGRDPSAPAATIAGWAAPGAAGVDHEPAPLGFGPEVWPAPPGTGQGSPAPGAAGVDRGPTPLGAPGADGDSGLGTNTTIGVIATNATLDKLGCLLVAQSGHDGMARALAPAHTSVDGDALVAAAVGGARAPLDIVRQGAALVVEDAIRAAVGGGRGG